MKPNLTNSPFIRRLLNYSAFALLSFCFLLAGSLSSVLAQERVLLSPDQNQMPEEWQQAFRGSWNASSQAEYRVEPSTRSDHYTLVISADSPVRSRLDRRIPLDLKSEYKLSFWIKTENITGEDEDATAGLDFGNLEGIEDIALTGTNDWQRREVAFSTGGDDGMTLSLYLGTREAAQGTIWLDEVYLEQTSKAPLNPSVIVDLSQRGQQMSDYIYGQFIEHMGNCIYGGIWAEMLEDRKFFYKPDTEESPWNSDGNASAVSVDSVDSFVGMYTPVIRADGSTGLSQTKLWLNEGADYEGRIVLSGSRAVLPVDVTLSWGEDADEQQTVTINNITNLYESHPLNFTAGAKTETATLTITPKGKRGVLKIGTLSLMPSDNIEGFRPEVLALMKQLDSPVYRWPGGNFVSGYNWEDGIGERDKRPPRFEDAWDPDYMRRGEPWNAVEPNDVGIHEFMRLTELLDTEPFIAVNTGLGTVEQAAKQVEYLNGSVDTPMGKWRAENGHPEPFNVKFFAVGNEMFGGWQLGHMPLSDYVAKHNEVAKAMWAVDPDAKLIAVGAPGEWNEQMYTHSSDYMDYISEHFYRRTGNGGLISHVKQIPDAIRELAEEHRHWRNELSQLAGKDIDIAMDEWNYWYGDHVYGLLGTRYFLRDALGIAAGLNEYARQSDIYFMANYAQTVNVIGAIKATPREAFMESTGEVLKTYRQEFGYIPVSVAGDQLPFDIAATLSKDQQYLTVSVVNPTLEDRELQLSVTGGEINPNGTLYFITGDDPMVYNEVGQPEVVTQAKSAQLRDRKVMVPALSASIFKFPMQDVQTVSSN